MTRLIPILAYHSQNIANNEYHGNDHVAFQADMSFLIKNNFKFLSALDLVMALRERRLNKLAPKSVVVTFDDGPIYDAQDFKHPDHGYQKSMSNIMREHQTRRFLFWKKNISATSFVIASDQAREEIGSIENGANYLKNDFWSDNTNLLEIGVHSWDHVHPLSSEARMHADSLERFDKINDLDYMNQQVIKASRSIKNISGSKFSPVFAYPYGLYSDFLVNQYLPNQTEVMGAFTTDGRYCDDQTNFWAIPRFVCGHHWKSAEEFKKLMSN